VLREAALRRAEVLGVEALRSSALLLVPLKLLLQRAAVHPRGVTLLGHHLQAALRGSKGLLVVLLRAQQLRGQLAETYLEGHQTLALGALQGVALSVQLLVVLVHGLAVGRHLMQAFLHAVQFPLVVLLPGDVLVRRLQQAGPHPAYVPHDVARGAGAELDVQRVGWSVLTHMAHQGVHAVLDLALLVQDHLHFVTGGKGTKRALVRPQFSDIEVRVGAEEVTPAGDVNGKVQGRHALVFDQVPASYSGSGRQADHVAAAGGQPRWGEGYPPWARLANMVVGQRVRGGS